MNKVARMHCDSTKGAASVAKTAPGAAAGTESAGSLGCYKNGINHGDWLVAAVSQRHGMLS